MVFVDTLTFTHRRDIGELGRILALVIHANERMSFPSAGMTLARPPPCKSAT